VSTHHAASCYVCAWLKEADTNNSCFKNKNGGNSFPRIEDSIKELLNFKNTEFLTSAEAKLLNIFKRLNSIRNKIMHRMPPIEFNEAIIAFAATATIGMFHSVSRRTGKSFEDIFNEFSEHRSIVIEAIHYSRIEEYFNFVEQQLEHQHPSYIVSLCPACNTRSVVSGHCEACFEDIYEITCPSCDEEINILSSHPFDQHCNECGEQIKR